MIARKLLAVWLFTLACAAQAAQPAAAGAPDPGNLELASVFAAVADLDSGEVLYRKNAGHPVPIASITKLMTAVVVLDSGADLGEWLAVVEREHKAANNAYTRLRRGSEARRRDLLQIALMASENHAAYVLARHHPGGFAAFVAAMNAKAAALGMNDTRFVDPSGLSSENRSTASDLLRLARAAAGYPLIARFTQSERHSVQFRYPVYRLHYGNTNVLVYRDHWHIDLSKTGYLDEAGRCLLVVTEIDGRRLALVLLDSFGRRTPVGDVGRVRNWIETGESGAMAGPARRYERRKSDGLAEAGPSD